MVESPASPRPSPQYSYGPQEKNVITGSCAEALAAIARGALDLAGRTRAGADGNPAPGFTRAEHEVDLTFDWDDQKRTGYSCKVCGGGPYPTLGAMMSACRGALVVVSHAYLQTTTVVRVAEVKFTADVSQQTWALEWRTDCPEGKRWNEQIRAHEGKHRADNERVVQEWLRSTPRPTFEGEGTTAAERKADLERKAEEFRKAALEELEKRTKAASDAFHRTPAGGTATLDCSKCP